MRVLVKAAASWAALSLTMTLLIMMASKMRFLWDFMSIELSSFQALGRNLSNSYKSLYLQLGIREDSQLLEVRHCEVVLQGQLWSVWVDWRQWLAADRLRRICTTRWRCQCQLHMHNQHA